MRRDTMLALLVTLSAAHLLGAQAPQLSSATKAFVTVDAPVVALTHVRLIDGTGRPPADDQTVVIRDGRIAEVGPATSTPAPSGATVLSLAGRTVIPGMVGLHDHMYYYAGNHLSEMTVSGPRLYLAGGVTTIKTAGAFFPYGEVNLKRAIDRGEAAGPHMYVSVSVGSGTSSTGNQPVVSDLAGARRVVDYWVDEGVTWFGEGLPQTRELMGALIDQAHKRGAKVSGHICSVTHREAVALGIDNLDHGLITATDYLADKQPDRCPSDAMHGQIALDLSGDAVRAVFKDMLDHHVSMTSTLAVYELFVPTRPPSAEREARILPLLSADVVPEYRKARADIQNRGDYVVEPELFRKMMQYDRDFVRAGGVLAAGVDPWGHGSLPGLGNQRNFEVLVEAGLSPAEAVQVVTANGARVLGGAEQFGTVTAGKRADLVVLDGDPAARPTDIEKVSLVFKDGVGYDPAKLVESVKGMVGIR
jgi:imidazolonepropionase-like amidohydrolase